MIASRGKILAMGAVAAALGFAVSPAISVARDAFTPSRQAPAPVIDRDGLSVFTPASVDPRMAALFGKARFTSRDFHFTPSTEGGRLRKLTVAVRAPAQTSGFVMPEAAPVSPTGLGLTRSAYNLGSSLGWKSFAAPMKAEKADGAALAIKNNPYFLKPDAPSRLGTKVEVGADKGIGAGSRAITTEQSYSLSVGGSYRVARNLDVTAGVRYKSQSDRLQPMKDNRVDSQAVYVGTAFRF